MIKLSNSADTFSFFNLGNKIYEKCTRLNENEMTKTNRRKKKKEQTWKTQDEINIFSMSAIKDWEKIYQVSTSSFISQVNNL